MKTLSLTNLDRITELDFNRVSNVNAVGGRLSIAKFENLEVLKAAYNDLTKVTFSTSNNVTVKELDLSNNLLATIPNIGSLTGLETLDLSNNLLGSMGIISNLTNLETVDLSNNSLSRSAVNHVLTTLDTSGKNNGTIQIGGPNALPTLGNYNTEKLSLENKGWTVGINGGIDTSFTAAEGYSTGATALHPDWEGTNFESGDWQNDPTNGKISTTVSNKNIRTVNPMRAQVGDNITVSMIFDYGINVLNIDTVSPGQERTLMVSLTDVESFSQYTGTVLARPHLSFMTKFSSNGNNPANPAYVRLLQKTGIAGNASQIVGSYNAISLSDATADQFTLTLQFTIGADAASTSVTATLKSNVHFSQTTSGTINGIASDIYSSLISSTSNVKLSIQSGEMTDTNIGEINVYSVIARVN